MVYSFFQEGSSIDDIEDLAVTVVLMGNIYQIVCRASSPSDRGRLMKWIYDHELVPAVFSLDITFRLRNVGIQGLVDGYNSILKTTCSCEIRIFKEVDAYTCQVLRGTKIGLCTRPVLRQLERVGGWSSSASPVDGLIPDEVPNLNIRLFNLDVDDIKTTRHLLPPSNPVNGYMQNTNLPSDEFISVIKHQNPTFPLPII